MSFGIAEWAAIGAIFPAIYSVIESRRANRAVERQLSEEEERYLRAMAGSFQAWWVKKIIRGSEAWGLYLSHDDPTSGVLYDVEIRVQSGKDSLTKQPITKCTKIKQLPPGNYFQESLPLGEKYQFGFPENLDSAAGYVPVTDSPGHFVQSFKFQDHLGTRWEWTREGGLKKANPTAAKQDKNS